MHSALCKAKKAHPITHRQSHGSLRRNFFNFAALARTQKATFPSATECSFPPPLHHHNAFVRAVSIFSFSFPRLSASALPQAYRACTGWLTNHGKSKHRRGLLYPCLERRPGVGRRGRSYRVSNGRKNRCGLTGTTTTCVIAMTSGRRLKVRMQRGWPSVIVLNLGDLKLISLIKPSSIFEIKLIQHSGAHGHAPPVSLPLPQRLRGTMTPCHPTLSWIPSTRGR